MNIGIINYGMGNLHSIQNALNKIGVKNSIINEPKKIQNYTKLILPGVGSFNQAINNLRISGFESEIKEAVINKEIPLLGICLGMQLLAETGEEDGLSTGLSLIKGVVNKFEFDNTKLKIPHIGFNRVYFKETNGLFKDLGSYSDFYFVHSYKLTKAKESIISSYCNYGERFISSINEKNIFGTQFHPEKSQGNGLNVLRNFIKL